MGVVSAIVITSIALTVAGKVTRTEELEYAGLASGVVGGGLAAGGAFGALPGIGAEMGITAGTQAANLAGAAAIAGAAGSALSIAGKATGDESLANAGLAVGLAGTVTGVAAASGVFNAAQDISDANVGRYLGTDYVGQTPNFNPPYVAPLDAQYAAGTTPFLNQPAVTAEGIVAQAMPATSTEAIKADIMKAPDFSEADISSFDTGAPVGTQPPSAQLHLAPPQPQSAPGTPLTQSASGMPYIHSDYLKSHGLSSFSPSSDPTTAMIEHALKNRGSTSLWDTLDNLPPYAKFALATGAVGAVGSAFSSIPEAMTASDRLEFDKFVQKQRNDLAQKELDIRTKAAGYAPLVTFQHPRGPAGLMNRRA
jgi:hypothetical protein